MQSGHSRTLAMELQVSDISGFPILLFARKNLIRRQTAGSYACGSDPLGFIIGDWMTINISRRTPSVELIQMYFLSRRNDACPELLETPCWPAVLSATQFGSGFDFRCFSVTWLTNRGINLVSCRSCPVHLTHCQQLTQPRSEQFHIYAVLIHYTSSFIGTHSRCKLETADNVNGTGKAYTQWTGLYGSQLHEYYVGFCSLIYIRYIRVCRAVSLPVFRWLCYYTDGF
jgi:hypothetical protein